MPTASTCTPSLTFTTKYSDNEDVKSNLAWHGSLVCIECFMRKLKHYSRYYLSYTEKNLKFPIHKILQEIQIQQIPAHSCKYHTAFYDTFPTNIAYDILCSLHNIPYYIYLRNNGYSGFPTPCLRKKI